MTARKLVTEMNSTGKSTIYSYLKNELDDIDQDSPTIIFNIWIPVNTTFDIEKIKLFHKQTSSSHSTEINPLLGGLD